MGEGCGGGGDKVGVGASSMLQVTTTQIKDGRGTTAAAQVAVAKVWVGLKLGRSWGWGGVESATSVGESKAGGRTEEGGVLLGAGGRGGVRAGVDRDPKNVGPRRQRQGKATPRWRRVGSRLRSGSGWGLEVEFGDERHPKKKKVERRRQRHGGSNRDGGKGRERGGGRCCGWVMLGWEMRVGDRVGVRVGVGFGLGSVFGLVLGLEVGAGVDVRVGMGWGWAPRSPPKQYPTRPRLAQTRAAKRRGGGFFQPHDDTSTQTSPHAALLDSPIPATQTHPARRLSAAGRLQLRKSPNLPAARLPRAPPSSHYSFHRQHHPPSQASHGATPTSCSHRHYHLLRRVAAVVRCCSPPRCSRTFLHGQKSPHCPLCAGDGGG